MIRSYVVRFKALSIFAVAVATLAVASCSEDIAAGGGCPLLCPQQSAPLQDTIVDAVIVDTSAGGFPQLGFESNLLLASRGDTLDARIITRYDSIPLTYKFGADDSTIVRVDSAFLRGFIPPSDTALKFNESGTIEVYDVTAAANDTAVASLAAQFTAGNKLGSLDYLADDSPDTLDILLDTARVRSRILNGQSLRLGLKMVSAGTDQIRFMSAQLGSGFALIVYPNRDVKALPLGLIPRSATPVDPSFLQFPYGDFNIDLAQPAPAANALRVGGFPASRVLFRFSIPSRIVDSAIVIRATLVLTQRPGKFAQAGDSIAVQIVPIVASNFITDVHSLLEFAGSPSAFPVDSAVRLPSDSGTVDLQIVRLIRAWRGQDTLLTPRRAAVFISQEGTKMGGFDFYSIEAPLALRPKLRLTYVTSISTGRP